MSTSLSPQQQQHYPHQSSQSPLGGGSHADGQDSKSPLSSLNLGFLKGLTEKRTTREGNPPKRRGPKPDSKPALTRRQELNRQAQRTHRERKELYIKALEDEVLRLKEIYSNISHDKERLAEENRQLKALLAQNGMGGGLQLGGGGGGSLVDESMSNPSIGYTSSGSISGANLAPSSYTSAFTPPPAGQHVSRGISPHQHHQHHSGQAAGSSGAGNGGQQHNRNPLVDYDQAGIDFVLTLEKPCMDHLPWLVERGVEDGGLEPCGHALMASCPPDAFPELMSDIHFGYGNVPSSHNNNNSAGGGGGAASGQRPWQLSKGDLATLMDLSTRLDLDGEITPVMAWGMVLAHPRLGELGPADFTKITDELGSKVRCYGFGAVMEEFEVRDALENVFSTKPDFAMGY